MRAPLKVLFVCGRARLRSPTAERVFSRWPGIETASAGVADDADEAVSADHLAWADLVFVMEKRHRTKLRRRYGAALRATRLICLDIPDEYTFMEPSLIGLLEAKVGPLLRRARPSR